MSRDPHATSGAAPLILGSCGIPWRLTKSRNAGGLRRNRALATGLPQSTTGGNLDWLVGDVDRAVLSMATPRHCYSPLEEDQAVVCLVEAAVTGGTMRHSSTGRASIVSESTLLGTATDVSDLDERHPAGHRLRSRTTAPDTFDALFAPPASHGRVLRVSRMLVQEDRYGTELGVLGGGIHGDPKAMPLMFLMCR
jgi:hypothetical protein